MKQNSYHRLQSGLRFLVGFLLLSAAGWADSRVYVQFSPNAKSPVLAAVTQAGGRVHYEFDHLNAIAVTVPDQALAGLSRNPLIVLIEEDPVRLMFGQTVPYGVEMVQAPAAIAAGGTGAGIIVGVIDSGVFAKHVDFTGLSLTGEPLGIPETQEIAWNRDRSSHGTHVVGTIAAVNNTEGVVGVAPGVAGLYMVKVFGDTGNWIYSSTLLTAVQRAVENGSARIVSMSLGGKVASTTERNGMQALYDKGILLVAAAGNAGNTTTSYPAGYPSVISVAAVDSAMALADFSQRNSTVELAAPGVGVLSTVSYRNASLTVAGTAYMAGALEYTAQKTASGALVDGGLGLSSGPWSGKVVLVERGTNTFAEKVQNVAAGGGVAAVIYNNVPGGFSGTLGTAGSTIPAISITQEDGKSLLAYSPGPTATVSTLSEIDASGYDYYDGTSMATPHVSAVAALIWSKYPSIATNAQVRQALTESALDLGVPGRDNSFGYGLVRAGAALAKLDAMVGSGGGGGEVDTIPPVISNIGSRIINAKTGLFEVTWTTDEPATSAVIIGSKITSSSTLTTDHQINVKGTKGALITYNVRSTDQAGNTTTEGPFTHQN